MFIHNFKYSLKTLFRSKTLIFWTFAFPIILGLLFYLAFSDIEKNETLSVIDIAIVENEELANHLEFKSSMEKLSTGDNKLFNIKYMSYDDAKLSLDDKSIKGYVIFNKNLEVVVLENGVDATILKYATDEIEANIKIISSLVNEEVNKEISLGSSVDVEKIYSDVINLVKESNANIEDISRANLSYTMIEYYTLIAMSCLYGGMLSMYITNFKLANMNSVGKRTSISSSSKKAIILGSLCASFIVQLIGLLLLFLFTILVLNVSYGSLGLVILIAVLGSFAGLSLGIFIASVFKMNENNKIGILIAVVMFCSFLSGMMGITMKYIVDKYVPIINKINPAYMITDGLYSLYYYDNLDRYIINIISLILFSILMIIISYKHLRRQKYDSI